MTFRYSVSCAVVDVCTQGQLVASRAQPLHLRQQITLTASYARTTAPPHFVASFMRGLGSPANMVPSPKVNFVSVFKTKGGIGNSGFDKQNEGFQSRCGQKYPIRCTIWHPERCGSGQWCLCFNGRPCWFTPAKTSPWLGKPVGRSTFLHTTKLSMDTEIGASSEQESNPPDIQNISRNSVSGVQVARQRRRLLSIFILSSETRVAIHRLQTGGAPGGVLRSS